MAIKLVYTDIAIGAAEDAETTVSDAEAFSDSPSLPAGVNTGAVATLEPNGWGLSPEYKTKADQPFALWTKSKSSAAGVFESPPVISISFDAQYTSTGLTFRFSPGAGEWCSEIRVLWYQNGAIKEEGTFYPDSPLYAVENTVEAFDAVEIELIRTSLPNRRAKLEYIGIGVVREFTGKELTGASFIHEIDLVSDTVPVNVLDASFHSRTDVEFMFQKKQPVEAFDDESLIGVYFIEKGERTGARDYIISCKDAFGVLDLDSYPGGLWLEDTPIRDMLEAVLGGSFALDISADAEGITLRGYIPPGTKRAAIQHIAFAGGVCVDTSGSAKIRVFIPYTGAGLEIPARETYAGGKITTSDHVTGVLVAALNISDVRPGDNEDSIEFNGVKYRVYREEYTATNPNTTFGALENIKVYEKCYLVNYTNAQARADALLAYHMRRNRYSASHILRDYKPGDRAVVALPWGGTQTGHIVKMNLSMSGINASDSEFLLD